MQFLLTLSSLYFMIKFIMYSLPADAKPKTTQLSDLGTSYKLNDLTFNDYYSPASWFAGTYTGCYLSVLSGLVWAGICTYTLWIG